MLSVAQDVVLICMIVVLSLAFMAIVFRYWSAAGRKEHNDVIRLWRDNLVRHRNAMLDLNTAVGRRILP